ncbi:MAG: hypothetical protein BWZ10_01403 [candidate division BRC1 bacterium ADurb.BinA364]|nr:MAG: hypothetical protein BWZ10_01403 [candidate division BRC1 bacterium ADurb.BinA364]
MPHIYKFNRNTGALLDLTFAIPAALREQASGYRSAGFHNGMVFFLSGSNPQGPLRGALVALAFHGQSGQLLGARALPPYTNSRSFLSASDGHFYVGVRRTDLVDGAPRSSGRILKWVDDPLDPNYPLAFVEVGAMEGGEPAHLTEFNGRIWANTWPVADSDVRVPMGLYRSPALGPNGLSQSDRLSWQFVWHYGQYDKDPINSLVTGGGAMAQLGDWLYFGTMHVPGLAQAYAMRNGATDPNDVLINSQRGVAIFRLRERPGPQPRSVEVQLLYGRSELPVFDPATRQYGSNTRPTGYTPLFGDWGFGNFFNNYTWAMAELNGWLYVGTMDFSWLINNLSDYFPFPDIFGNSGIQIPFLNYGFDLMATNGERWVEVDRNGLGNPVNYGLRTLIADGDSLIAGTANPMNLHPGGGWELLTAPAPGRQRERLSLDRERYAMNATAQIMVNDKDLDKGGSVDTVRVFAATGADPAGEARRVAAFLGGKLHVERMAAAVDPDLYRNRAE